MSDQNAPWLRRHRSSVIAAVVLALMSLLVAWLVAGLPQSARYVDVCGAGWSPDGRKVVVTVMRYNDEKELQVSADSRGRDGREKRLDDIYLVRISGWSGHKLVARGADVRICSVVPYVLYLTPGMHYDDPMPLWLTNYETGEKSFLDAEAWAYACYTFSPDGKAVQWVSALPNGHRMAPVDHPDRLEISDRIGDELFTLSSDGWQWRSWRWGADGSMYYRFLRPIGKGPDWEDRWIRYAAPAWQMEDVGPPSAEEQKEEVRPTAFGKQKPEPPGCMDEDLDLRGIPSPDGKLLLKCSRTRGEHGTTRVELMVESQDGKKRRIAVFKKRG